jgi:WD40 repeat protein
MSNDVGWLPRKRRWLDWFAVFLVGSAAASAQTDAAIGRRPSEPTAAASAQIHHEPIAREWFIDYFRPHGIPGIPVADQTLWSPDGRFALLRTETGKALLFGAAQAGPIASIPASGQWYGAVWSADSRQLLVVEADDAFRFTLLDIESPEQVSNWELAIPPVGAIYFPLPVGFFPDGKRVLIQVASNSLRVQDATTGRLLGGQFAVDGKLALARTKPWLAQEAADGGFRITDVETGRILLASSRHADSFAWFGAAPKLAVESDSTCLIWDEQGKLRELPVSGKPIWDHHGQRLAFGSPTSESRRGQPSVRCTNCLPPVPWSTVYDLAKEREVPSTGFVPDDHRYELFDQSILDRATGVTRPRKLAHAPVRNGFRFRDEETLLMFGTSLSATIDIATGKVKDWVKDPPQQVRSADPEIALACEDGRWAIRNRFSRQLIFRLPADTDCDDSGAFIWRLPFIAYIGKGFTRIIDRDTGATVARLGGTRPLVDDELFVTQSLDVPPGQARCEAFHAPTRKVTVTPAIPKGKSEFWCMADGLRGIRGTAVGGETYFFRPGKGFLNRTGLRVPVATAFCPREVSETPSGAVCVDKLGRDVILRIWDARSDRVSTTKLHDTDKLGISVPFGHLSSTTSVLLDPSQRRLAFFAVKNQCYVATVATGATARWGPAGFVPVRWQDERTLIVENPQVRYEPVRRPRLTLAVRDGVVLDTPPGLAPGELPPQRFKPKLAKVFTSEISPSGRLAIQGMESPFFLSRFSDGSFLRLLVVEEGGRPYSVLVDNDGHYAGDDVAARYLWYASGTSVANAVLRNGLEVAPRFRDEARILAFARRP